MRHNGYDQLASCWPGVGIEPKPGDMTLRRRSREPGEGSGPEWPVGVTPSGSTPQLDRDGDRRFG